MSARSSSLSPAARLKPSFPLTHGPVLAGFAVPDSLRISLPSIDRPSQLPRFLLLGERDDDSFRRDGEEFTCDYVWPEFSDGPVCQLRSRGEQLRVKESWKGEEVSRTHAAGPTLTRP